MRPSHIARAALVLAVLAVATSAVSAKPRPASGANCSPDWVNNSGAMDCFIQGEEDVHAGVAHPHYVACLNGAVFCCVDTSAGQHCEAQASTGGKANVAAWLRALLAAQQTHLATVSRLSKVPGHATGATDRSQ